MLEDPEVEPGGWEERLAVDRARVAAHGARSPLERIEGALHPWVAFLIMPVFALANAGVAVNPQVVGDPLALAAGVALVVGKPVGILLAAGIVVWLGIASLPRGVNWKILAAAACLAGIGFTMSLFIAGLSLADGELAAAKTGVLIGSALSGCLGLAGLMAVLPSPTHDARPAAEDVV